MLDKTSSRLTCQVSWQSHHISIGGGCPVVVQSMTNTETADHIATALQIKDLVNAGSELVRITVNNDAAAAAVPKIREQLDRMHINVPLIGDFHYNGHQLLTQYPDAAACLSKYRINPGNIGRGEKRDKQFAQMIEVALRFERPIRIGVNWGSLDQELLAIMMDENQRLEQPQTTAFVLQEALLKSALDSATYAQKLGMPPEKIVLSCKVSGVQELVQVYRRLHQLCRYPLHLGLTEAGMGLRGIVASTASLAVLLQEGIGDTIRISLTPEPQQDRSAEVQVAWEILQSLGLRAYTPTVTACPGCGRTTSHLFQELAQQIDHHLREHMPYWRKTFIGVETMKVAVMGCVVNGPGESKFANIGISLPGNGEKPAAPVYADGFHIKTLRGENIAKEFLILVENYVETHYKKVSLT